jgi:hypothetical protein
MNTLCDDYLGLIDRFMSSDMLIGEFQTLFFDKFKLEKREMSEELYLVLGTLFSDLDTFTDDEYLLKKFPQNYQDRTTLLKKICLAREKLQKWSSAGAD